MLLNSAPPPSALVSTSVFSVVPLCRPLSLFLCSELGIFSLMLFCNVSLWLCLLLLSCMYRRIVSVFFLSLGECRPLSFENMDIFLYCRTQSSSSLFHSFIRKSENIFFSIWFWFLNLSSSSRSRFNFSFYSRSINFFVFIHLGFTRKSIMIIFFNFCSASRFRLIMCVRIRESDTVYYIVSRWLRENCSIPIVDILYKVRNAKCSLVTLQIDGMWFNGEYRRKTGVSMRVSPFVFIPMKA